MYGSGLSRICQERPATREPRQRIIACFWKQSSGAFGPAHHGATDCPAMHVYMHERGPPAFGNWNSQFRRFRRWAKAGVFESLFNAMSGAPDLEYALIPFCLKN